MEQNKQLGEEKISRLLLKFSVPCIMGLVISALYNIVDQIFIGNSDLGFIGNAATGVSFPVICIANAFAWCIGDGAASFLSICAGRKDTENAHKCVGTGITSAFCVSILLSAVCLIFPEPLLNLFGASDQTLAPALSYFRIIVAFFPVYLMFNVMNSMIRADGSPGYAMIGIVSGAVLNVILDPIFIFVLGWSIRGAAIATGISQTLSFLICAAYFFHPKTFRLTKKSFLVDFRMLKNLIKLGGSTFITQISIVVMNVLSNITLFHYGQLSVYGSDIPISVFSIQTKVYTIINNIIVGIALGGQPILGYNYGARRMDRVKEAYRIMLTATISVTAAATLIFELCPQILIRIFGNGSALYMDFAVKSFRIYLSLSILTGFIKMSAVFFQSIGKPVQSMISSILKGIICLVPFTLLLCRVLEQNQPGTGIFGVLIAGPLADLVSGIAVGVMTVFFFRSLKNQKPSEENEPVIQPSRPGIILTISRQHGTCGKQIGALTAKQLSVPFYSKEMTALAARESGLADEFISEMDENAPDLFRQLYLSTTVVQEAVTAQEKIIRRIADEGACVIVGRAADYVLRGRPDVIRVFLYAPEEKRIANIMEMYHDTEEAARAQMNRSDRARAAYYQNISGRKWADVNNYDLCVDASAGKEAVAGLLADYVRRRESQKD